MSNNGLTTAAIIAEFSLAESKRNIDIIEGFLEKHNEKVILEFCGEDPGMQKILTQTLTSEEPSLILVLSEEEAAWLHNETKEMLRINDTVSVLSAKDKEMYADLYNSTSPYSEEEEEEEDAKIDPNTEVEQREYFVFPNGNFYLAEEGGLFDDTWMFYDGTNTVDELVEFMGKINTKHFLNAIM